MYPPSLSSPTYRIVTQYGLKKPGSQPAYVEWSYCFDVHLNALFPLVLCVYGVQIVAWPRELTHTCTLHLVHPPSSAVLIRPNIVSCLMANTLWSAAFLYYIYLTFLGYTGETAGSTHYGCGSTLFPPSSTAIT